jgi:cellulose synthase/poly-beta-1,6-N-acetylglucosamine synthase-like glycosyltransferase
MPYRGGKTIGLNRAVAEARGEIVIFSDANAIYDRKAVRNLLRNFGDPAVGCVTGESRYFFDEESASVKSENLYWTYEIVIKKLESRLGSTVGGDGAIYALRKSLYEPMEASDLSDFVNPLQVVRRGFRNIYDPEAYCIEAAAESFEKEFRRKVRIVNRAWRGLWNQKKVLNPFRYGFFAIQVWSHKLLRWCIPLFLMLAFATNLILAGKGSYYTGTFFLQITFYMLAWVGGRFSGGIGRMRMFYVPYYFSVVNWASLLGIIENFRGNTFVVWDTVREESSKARA